MSGTYTPQEGKGTIFKNDRKEKDSQPGWRGTIMVGGTVMEIAMWEREGRRGTFYSVSVSPARERQAPAPQPQPSRNRQEDRDPLDSDIPF